MKKTNELEYYEERKNWDFDKYEIESECLTNWDLYEILRKVTDKNSKILDLGTAGGEKVLKYFPDCAEILGTDLSTNMIETAKKNLKESGKNNIHFKVMDNLKMDVPDEYFDVVVARHTVTDPVQIYKCLKTGGYLLIRGVDKADCLKLKLLFNRGQGYNDKEPISIIDYKNVINAGFKDVELVPIHVREYFSSVEKFKRFLKDVPILDDFSEEELTHHKKQFDEHDNELLNQYIKGNTHNGKIQLLRRYYGISAKK